MKNLTVPAALCRNANRDPEAVVDDAVWLIDHMSRQVGRPDLADVTLLDFGCGVRFTQAFLDRDVPIERYVGVDVSRDVIDFLRANVSDSRFEFFHLDAHNDLYNPTGRPLRDLTVPELEGRQFELICLFSVFTHLAPHDYVAMLRLLRRYVRPDGRLFYTAFINERTEAGHGYVDQMSRALARSDDPVVKARLAAADASVDPPDFLDADRSKPLLVAMYSRRHAIELLDDTGWRYLDILPPMPLLQHQVVCAPIG